MTDTAATGALASIDLSDNDAFVEGFPTSGSMRCAAMTQCTGSPSATGEASGQ